MQKLFLRKQFTNKNAEEFLLSNDCRFLAVKDKKGFRKIYAADTWHIKKRIPECTFFSFSPDSNLAGYTTEDNYFYLLSVKDFKQVLKLQNSSYFKFSSNRKFIIIKDVFSKWHIYDGITYMRIITQYNANLIEFSGNEQYALIFREKSIELCSTENWHRIKTFRDTPFAQFSQDSRYASVKSSDNCWHIIDLSSSIPEIIRTYENINGTLGLQFIPKRDTICLNTNDNTFSFICLKSGDKIHEIHNAEFIKFSEEGDLAAVKTGNSIWHIYDTKEFKISKTFENSNFFEFSKNSGVAACEGSYNKTDIYRLNNWEKIKEIHDAGIFKFSGSLDWITVKLLNTLKIYYFQETPFKKAKTGKLIDLKKFTNEYKISFDKEKDISRITSEYQKQYMESTDEEKRKKIKNIAQNKIEKLISSDDFCFTLQNCDPLYSSDSAVIQHIGPILLKEYPSNILAAVLEFSSKSESLEWLKFIYPILERSSGKILEAGLYSLRNKRNPGNLLYFLDNFIMLCSRIYCFELLEEYRDRYTEDDISYLLRAKSKAEKIDIPSSERLADMISEILDDIGKKSSVITIDKGNKADSTDITL